MLKVDAMYLAIFTLSISLDREMCVRRTELLINMLGKESNTCCEKTQRDGSSRLLEALAQPVM